ncbi:hypothetical protein NQ318_012380 [Aromia moschata]|uniref:Carboxylic ester hydrolase n=1 Tax=Aromia moschata TaxID=1265417 RepID=A0AAV8Y442_9CUCU|nr:hypothetical protein NQ318_012380 [Aromia moschata]
MANNNNSHSFPHRSLRGPKGLLFGVFGLSGVIICTLKLRYVDDEEIRVGFFKVSMVFAVLNLLLSVLLLVSVLKRDQKYAFLYALLIFLSLFAATIHIESNTSKNVTFIVIFTVFANGQDDLVVSTKNGLVRGKKAATEDTLKIYNAFKGIPYAEPPIGNLRFSAPVPKKNWTGILNATADQDECLQGTNRGSEDCLYINVYTPYLLFCLLLFFPYVKSVFSADQTSKIIGSDGMDIRRGFLEGDSKYKDYGPDYLLEDDVVVVTFNYRLGVFGFFGTSDMAAPGNWGTKDQILALSWVQDNIENFGGDPNRVTIFGESAGSASVSFILLAPLKRKLFHGAIMQSGTALNLWALSRHPRETAFDLGIRFGIVTRDSTELVEKLRKIDARSMLEVSTAMDLQETLLTNPRDGLVFSPCEEVPHEGAAVLGKSHERLKNGNFSRVPMIVGFNSQEGIFFVKRLQQIRLYLATYDLAPVRLIPIDMNVRPLQVPIVATKIKTKYFGLAPVTMSDAKLTQFVTDDQFVRAIDEASRLMSNYATVYNYILSYEGPLGINIGQPPRSIPGVAHGEDLNYIWRKWDNIRNPTKSDLLTRKRLVKLWTNFAKTLNPTPEKDTLFQNVTWALRTSESPSYLDIGENIGVRSNLSSYSVDWWRQLYEQYGNPPYDTY